jgi:Ca-activated chloride channel family protein
MLARQIMKVSSRIVPFIVLALARLLFQVNCSQAQEAQPSPATSQLVTLTAIITDRLNHSVDDVRQEEIQVVQDKMPQAISYFSRDLRTVHYGLVLDTSESFKSLLSHVVQAAKALINSNQPEDETFIERFVDSDKIETVQEFTADKSKLNAALDSLYIRGGQTAVVDAVYLAVKHTAEYSGGSTERRHAVVLFTDGEDRGSYYGSDKLVKLLRENDVQVFIVGIVNLLDKEAGLIRKSPREAAETLLKRIAEESGGRVFFPGNVNELSEALTHIAHDLHFQYLIRFERQRKPGEKGFRKLKVALAQTSGREKVTLIARPGYLINDPGQKTIEIKSP